MHLLGAIRCHFFSGKGKKTAFQAWKSYPEAADVFRALSLPQTILSEQHFKPVISGGEHFQVQQTGDGISLRMAGYRPGLPFLKPQKLVTS